MEPKGGMSDGGVGIEPWQIPRLGEGGETSFSNRSIGQSAGGTTTGLAQASTVGGSTGMGGTFAEWPGHMQPAWQHRGFFGGPGIRTGGYA